MVKKVKKAEEKPLSREPSPKSPKKRTILGTHHALTLSTTQGTALHLSYWDLWFSIVAVVHNGQQVQDFDAFFNLLARRPDHEMRFLCEIV